MAYTKYSLTPANNTAAPPDGAPEGMLPSAVNDTMRDMMAQIRDVGDGVRDGTYTMTAPKITGGTINGATIGATTASTGKFTAVTNSALTSGRVTYAGTAGVLQDSAGLTYDGAILTISSGASASALTATSTSSGGTALNIQNSGTVNALIGGYLSCIGSGSASDVAVAAYQGALAFATNGANERMRITSAGLVGIGTTSPAYKLVVIDTANAKQQITFSDNASFFGSISHNSGTGQNEYRTEASGGHGWFIGTSSTTANMTLNPSGNLLLGTTSSIGNGGVLQAKGSGPVFYLETNSSSGSQNVLDIANVSNTAYKPMRFWVNGYGTTEVGSITCTTVLTSYNQTSDYRLKENIAPMTGALAKVAQLNPVTYKWKTDGSDGQGFIAHELAEVVPDCVTGEKDAVDEDGKPQYQAMDTSHLIATLVSAIQEQQALIESLTTRLTALENK